MERVSGRGDQARGGGARGGAAPATARRARRIGSAAGDTGTPVLFQKSNTVIIGNGDSIVVPRGALILFRM